MFTIIGGDGKAYGPATLEQIRAWIAAGRANLETQARRQGEEQWHALGDFPEFNAGGATPSPPVTAVARIPAQGPVVVDPKAYADDLIARAAPLGISDCLERSWNLLKANFWPIVGSTFIALAVMIIANAIPILGMVAGLLLTGVFYGGLYAYYLKRIRGQPTELADIFNGFTLAFVPLMFATLVTSLLTTLGVLLLILPGVYLGVAYTFTFMLVIDQRLEFWAAMEVSRRVITAQWWRMFGLLILAGIIALLGVFGLVIGLFITIPIYIGAIVFAYEDLCNPPPRQ
jgi:hypothetical protein